jgi:hypothetical protein
MDQKRDPHKPFVVDSDMKKSEIGNRQSWWLLLPSSLSLLRLGFFVRIYIE